MKEIKPISLTGKITSSSLHGTDVNGIWLDCERSDSGLYMPGLATRAQRLCYDSKDLHAKMPKFYYFGVVENWNKKIHSLSVPSSSGYWYINFYRICRLKRIKKKTCHHMPSRHLYELEQIFQYDGLQWIQV